MGYVKTLLIVLAVGAFGLVRVVRAAPTPTVIAYDDAADGVYAVGNPYHALNGGFGLTPWIHSLPAFPSGSGGPLHAYVGSSTANDPIGPTLTNIDTAGRAWGNNADPTGSTFLARRSLAFDLPVGGTYSISYDAGNVDGPQTISFGLAGNAMCSFFFNPSSAPNYQFTDVLSSTSLVTPIAQDWGGLRLTLTRDTATTYFFEIKRLADNFTFGIGPFAYDTTTITGIRTINVSNVDGGAGLGHSMYLNAIEATAIPEPVGIGWAVGLATFVRMRKKRS
ncbi:MAG TPA: hypothetical protein VF669_16195 [Tepidisphaeraceae bacterium]|jgi:hypothetical protein